MNSAKRNILPYLEKYNLKYKYIPISTFVHLSHITLNECKVKNMSNSEKFEIIELPELSNTYMIQIYC